jgi:alkylated DNA repair protein alkB family protein 4
LKLGNFSGLPSFSQEVVERMRKVVEGLGDFTPVELCNLDYRPERGAAIDPHVDDSWIWGERLVTINLLSDSVLTFTCADDHTHSFQVEISMPRCSLIVVSGQARFQWQHSIQRCHVTSRRIAITLRELSTEFSPGGTSYKPMGQAILNAASLFNDQPVNKVPQSDD